MEILDGKKVAKTMKAALKEKIKNEKLNLTLSVIKVGNDPASEVYIKNKEKACQEVGISFTKIEFPEDTSSKLIEDKILELNLNNKINGILLQLPLPVHLDENKLINLILPSKDVDGLTTVNAGLLATNQAGTVSCTPAGVIRLLKEYNIEIAGKHIVIIGRSNLVGKPLYNLFLLENATVTICHSKTVNLEQYTKLADILVVAVGKKHIITKNLIKDNAVIIDVGITRENGQLYGDVDFDNVKDKCQYITPVPGGVGPMTIAMLLENVYNSKN